MSQTCSNLIMGNQNGIGKVVLVSLLLNWDMLTRVSAVTASDNDHQETAVDFIITKWS